MIEKRLFNKCVFLWQEYKKQSGAVEACWAHNPEVDRSKLSSAIFFFLYFFSFYLFYLIHDFMQLVFLH